MSRIHSIFLVSSVLMISACSNVSVYDLEGREPSLKPNEFFVGKLCADGVVRDRSGQEIRSFNAELIGTWDEQGVGVLDEVFYFYDEPGTEPKRETRIWTFVPQETEEGLVYQASAPDVPEGTLMKFSGNGIHMEYMLRYKTDDGSTIDLMMNDWMYQVADGVVINETQMSKFGLNVGQVLLVMRKVSEDTACLPQV